MTTKRQQPDPHALVSRYECHSWGRCLEGAAAGDMMHLIDGSVPREAVMKRPRFLLAFRAQTWQNIDDGLDAMRGKLTEKYMVEF